MNDNTNLKQTLDQVPKIIAALSFVLLALTVIHEWAYFRKIGPHIQSIVSAYDYVSNAILWLPQNLTLIGLFLLLQAVIARVMGHDLTYPFKEDAQRAAALTETEQRVFMRMSASLVVGAIVAASVTYFFVDNGAAYGYALSAINLWFAVFCFFHNEQYALGARKASAILLLPPFLFVLFATGVVEAEQSLTNFDNKVYRVKFKESKDGKESNEYINVFLLRTLDKGILVGDPVSRRIHFIRWDVVQSISGFGPESSVSARCQIFSALCRINIVSP